MPKQEQKKKPQEQDRREPWRRPKEDEDDLKDIIQDADEYIDEEKENVQKKESPKE